MVLKNIYKVLLLNPFLENTTKMRIALISLNQSWENKLENQRKITECFSLISKFEKKVDWIIFPEMTLTSFTMNSVAIKEEIDASETIDFFRKCSIENQMYVAFGVVLAKGEKATNNLLIINPEGKIIANYAKIHPFSYANENDYYVAGSELVSCSVNNNPIGLTICYDLRFPELYQALSKENKVIVNIANWPSRRVLHWETLLKARAIENQLFMIGVNRIGQDGNGLIYEKSSTIISPLGEMLHSKKISQEIDVYEINISEVDEYRKSFPVKTDRKVDFYKSIL